MERGGACLMIKSITVTNPQGESLELELRHPEKSGFIVQKIEGLGPTKANVNTTELATGDGAIYSSARATSRNIVMTLKFMFAPTIEDIRQKSYLYFPLKKKVKIEVETDNKTLYTYGYVEANEPIIFSKDTGTQISILCPDPFLYSKSIMTTVFSGVESVFEFPFSNESLTENLLEMGRIVNEPAKSVYYEGNVDTGVTIYIHATGDASGVSIYNSLTREQMHLNLEILAGDDIIINTVKGSKSISLIREGVKFNVLNMLDRMSDWFTITRGDNVFVYEADIGANNLQFRIENHILYEGV